MRGKKVFSIIVFSLAISGCGPVATSVDKNPRNILGANPNGSQNNSDITVTDPETVQAQVTTDIVSVDDGFVDKDPIVFSSGDDGSALLQDLQANGSSQIKILSDKKVVDVTSVSVYFVTKSPKHEHDAMGDLSKVEISLSSTLDSNDKVVWTLSLPKDKIGQWLQKRLTSIQVTVKYKGAPDPAPSPTSTASASSDSSN